MGDPLASFRRNQPDANPQQQAGGLKPYEAYRVQGGRHERMEIRRVLGETHAPSYRYLMDVAFNGQYGTEIVLLYSFLMVKITGRNLQPVVAAILENSCMFIQDFHPNEFLQAPQNAPFIEFIEFVSEK